MPSFKQFLSFFVHEESPSESISMMRAEREQIYMYIHVRTKSKDTHQDNWQHINKRR
jgi:sarcosine oxidase delta subunit